MTASFWGMTLFNIESTSAAGMLKGGLECDYLSQLQEDEEQ